MLIVLDGLDASGKATQTKLLVEELQAKGDRPVKHISFPDYNEKSSTLVKMYLDGEISSNPDDINPYAASSFYASDRYISYKKYWEKDYLDKSIIVADRYSTSNIIHQMSKLPKDDWKDFIRWVEYYEYELLKLPKPDIVVLLYMPVAVSQRLLQERGNKKDIHELNVGYLQKCEECAKFAGRYLGWRIINCANGNEPRSIEEIHKEVMKKVGL